MKSILYIFLLLCQVTLGQIVSSLTNWDGSDSTILDLPQMLSETGFDPNNNEVFVPYEVNVPQYLNLMNIDRYVSVPAGQTIVPGDTMNYTFPAGTVFVRVISLSSIYGDPTTKNNIEVQMQIRSTDERWLRLLYVYGPNRQDAELMNGTQFFSLKHGTDLQGKVPAYVNQETGEPADVVSFKYFRTQRSCNNCHYNSSTNGFITQQLNRGNQLQELVDKNVLSELPDLNGMQSRGHILKWVDKEDTAAGLADRALSYLAANCSHCHNHLEERATTGKLSSFQYFRPPTSNIPDFMTEALTFKAGKPDSSVAINRLVQGSMPGGAMVDLPDAVGIKVLWDWVNSLDGNSSNDVPFNGLEVVKIKAFHQTNFNPSINVSFSNSELLIKGIDRQKIDLGLFTLLGRRIVTTEINPETFFVGERLSPGIYFLKINNNVSRLSVY